jgi:hypothetical protein
MLIKIYFAKFHNNNVAKFRESSQINFAKFRVHKFDLFSQEFSANYYGCIIWFWTRSGFSPLNWHTHVRLILKLHHITVLFLIISWNFLSFSEMLWYFLFYLAKFRESRLWNSAKISRNNIKILRNTSMWVIFAKFRIHPSYYYNSNSFSIGCKKSLFTIRSSY